MTAYGEAVRQGDIPSVLGFWAADALIQEVETQVEGPEVTQRAQEFFPYNRITEFTTSAAEVEAHDGGAVAYQWGQVREAMQPKVGVAAPTSYRTNFVARWVRGDDGVWRIHRFMAVPAPEAPRPVATASKASDGPVGTLDDRISVDQVAERMNEYVAAIRANSIDDILTFWTDDAQFIQPEVHAVGKPAVAQLVSEVLGANRIAGMELTSREIFVHDEGGVAYQYGSYVETMEPRDGKSAAVVARCNFVARWRRQSDGLWRMDAFMATPQPK